MFSINLKNLRKRQGLNQVELAKSLNVATGTVAMWETGKREPNFDMLNRLSVFFQVSTDHLLGREEKESPPPDPLKQELNDLCAKMTTEQMKKLLLIMEMIIDEQKKDPSA